MSDQRGHGDRYGTRDPEDHGSNEDYAQDRVHEPQDLNSSDSEAPDSKLPYVPLPPPPSSNRAWPMCYEPDPPNDNDPCKDPNSDLRCAPMVLVCDLAKFDTFDDHTEHIHTLARECWPEGHHFMVQAIGCLDYAKHTYQARFALSVRRCYGKCPGVNRHAPGPIMNNKKIRWWWERGYEVSSLPRVPCYTREVTEKDYICDPLVFNCVLRHIERNVFFDELYAFAEWHFGRDHFQITCIDDSNPKVIWYRVIGFACFKDFERLYGRDCIQEDDAQPKPTGDMYKLWNTLARQIRQQCPRGAAYNRRAPVDLPPWMDWGIKKTK